MKGYIDTLIIIVWGGVSTLGPELLMAVLAVVFSNYNYKLIGKFHVSNSKNIPTTPAPKPAIISKEVVKSNLQTQSSLPPDSSILQTSDQEVIVQHIFNRIKSIKTSLDQLFALSVHRNFKCENVLNLNFMHKNSANDNSIVDTEFAKETLNRNCAAFNLCCVSVPADGDCFFRSLLRQLKTYKLNELLENRLKSLNILFMDETLDILSLR